MALEQLLALRLDILQECLAQDVVRISQSRR